MIDCFPIHITLNYESFGGTAYGRTGGLGGGISVDV